MASQPIKFTRWSGAGGLDEFCRQQTGCAPFSSAGICPRREKKTTILRSVDDTHYYDDEMSSPALVRYTLFGPSGNQDRNEKKFNAPFLDPKVTEHIYLYRVSKEGKKTVWLWYGKYQMTGTSEKQHVGKDGLQRNIILAHLTRV